MTPPRDASYRVFGARLSTRGDRNNSAINLDISSFLIDPNSMAAFYGVEGGRYSLISNKVEREIEREEQSFFASQIVHNSSEGTRYERQAADGSVEEFIRSRFRQPVNHVLAAIWESRQPLEAVHRSLVFGLPTEPAEIPTTGTLRFSYLAVARVTGPTAGGSLAASPQLQVHYLVADFASAEVKGILSFGACNPGVPCGDYAVRATFSRADGRIRGTIDLVTGGYSGRVDGSFFGSVAREIGLVFQFRSVDGTAAVGHLVGTAL